jgi:hypothetical protein
MRNFSLMYSKLLQTDRHDSMLAVVSSRSAAHRPHRPPAHRPHRPQLPRPCLLFWPTLRQGSSCGLIRVLWKRFNNALGHDALRFDELLMPAHIFILGTSPTHLQDLSNSLPIFASDPTKCRHESNRTSVQARICYCLHPCDLCSMSRTASSCFVEGAQILAGIGRWTAFLNGLLQSAPDILHKPAQLDGNYVTFMCLDVSPANIELPDSLHHFVKSPPSCSTPILLGIVMIQNRMLKHANWALCSSWQGQNLWISNLCRGLQSKPTRYSTFYI